MKTIPLSCFEVTLLISVLKISGSRFLDYPCPKAGLNKRILHKSQSTEAFHIITQWIWTIEPQTILYLVSSGLNWRISHLEKSLIIVILYHISPKIVCKRKWAIYIIIMYFDIFLRGFSTVGAHRQLCQELCQKMKWRDVFDETINDPQAWLKHLL